MKSFLKRLFFENWVRKSIALGLALIVWFVVSQSLTTTKTISNIQVRIVNLPQGKTIEGLQINQTLNKRVSLTLTGNKDALEDLTSNDIEVVIDASDIQTDSVMQITKRNLSPLNPDLNISRSISKVAAKNLILKLTKLSSEKIPIIITQPIGEAPKGYQFLDVWPYQLYITIQGPEEVLKRLKTRGIKLTFNLNDISKAQLDDLQITTGAKADVVSFYVPADWKRVPIQAISDNPIEINDPDAKYLRIDFVKSELIPIKYSIPVNFFLPPPYSNTINAQKLHIATNELVELRNGLKVLNTPLFAKGVSELFVEVVKDMFEILVIISPKSENQLLDWSIQFINPRVLENKYLSILSSDVSDENMQEQPMIREEYLRVRFRNYMNRFQLFKPNDQKFDLVVQIKGNAITITETGSSAAQQQPPKETP